GFGPTRLTRPTTAKTRRGRMAPMTVCLSTNGVNVHRADAPPTRLLVATARGVSVLQRARQGAPWQLAETVLCDMHPSALLREPENGGIFAGIHNGGLYFSADAGATWQRRTNGLSIEHVFSLR